MTYWRMSSRGFKTVVLLGCLLLCTGRVRAQSGPFEQHVAAAVQAQSAGDVTAAIAEYKGALAIQPGAAEIWANLGLMQHQAKDYSGAMASFVKAHRLQPKLFVPVFFLGLECLDAGRLAEAVGYLAAARKMKPDDWNVPMYLGRAYFEMNRFDDAVGAYSEATRLNAANGEAWYRLGIAYLKSAEQDSGRLAGMSRQSPYFEALAADSFSSQNKLDRAVAAYRSALAARSHPPCIRSSLGLVLVRQNKLADAGAEFEQDMHAGGCLQAQLGLVRIALEKGPANAQLPLLGAVWKVDRGFAQSHGALLTEGLTSDQLAKLNQSLAATDFPGLSSEEAVELRASVNGVQSGAAHPTAASREWRQTSADSATEDFAGGRYERCVSDLRGAHVLAASGLSTLAACAFFTGDYTATLDAARRLVRNRETQDAGLYWSVRARQALTVECLLRAGQTSPDSLRLHELLAESYRDMGRYGAAEAEYETALKIAPDAFAVLLGAAANYLQEYRIELADRMIRRALDQNQSDPEANYIMGEVLMDEHHLDEAEPHLKIGLSAKPELVPRVHALLGQIYASRGEDARAIEELKLGEASDDDGSVHFQLGRLYQKTGQTKLAAAAFEETHLIQNKTRNQQ
ncbi:tetratricopeptide repeat protein [Edaphobacter sp.]|uniref:tetratricopeptide repeat protein n=1 Tax=Edaphobacter sp. TaxID=1934404 RepID=UPI002DB68882|nr:tetratricopeptide repeat protein [Edaphobacter sp.]